MIIYRFVLLFSFIGPTTWAAERYEFYNGTRQMGMGGASVAVVNDETALISNPAALGKLRNFFLTIADPEVEVNSQAQSIVGTNILKGFNVQDALNMLNEPGNQGKRLHQAAKAFPSLVVPNFGIGVYGRYVMDAEVNQTTNLYEVTYYNDFAIVTGFNFRFFDGRLKLGANARITNRVELVRTDLDPTSQNLKLNDLANEGIGVASDVGLLLAAPWDWLPTLGAVWRDVGNTTYTIRDGFQTNAGDSRRPNTTKSTVDVGIGLFPIIGKRTRTSFTLEYQDVLTADEEEDHLRRAHGGIEFNFRDAFFFRAGMNQRYWTTGLELAVLNYQLQIASYGEEIGVDKDNTREDRRYMFKFAYRF